MLTALWIQVLIRPPARKTVVPGNQRPTRMVPCIFTIAREYATHLGTCCAQTRLTRLQRLFTDTDMHHPALREQMEAFYRTLEDILRDRQLTIPSKNYDLVLDIQSIKEKTIVWSYYYACHEKRCLFWLGTYDANHMVSELYGVECPAHVSASRSFARCPLALLIRCTDHRMEDLYWYINSFLLNWLLNIEVVLVGTTGHSFRSLLKVAVFHWMSMINSWGCWPMVA